MTSGCRSALCVVLESIAALNIICVIEEVEYVIDTGEYDKTLVSRVGRSKNQNLTWRALPSILGMGIYVFYRMPR